FQKMHAHRTEPAAPVRHLRAEVPEALAAVVERMLAKRPEDRPSTPGKVAANLERFAVGHVLPVLQVPTVQGITALPAGGRGPPPDAGILKQTTTNDVSAALAGTEPSAARAAAVPHASPALRRPSRRRRILAAAG